MHWIDWTILLGMTAVICVVAYQTRKYTRSVADFLAANRCAGKYVLGVADGIAGLGAITVVGFFEMYYKAGFSAVWWGAMMMPFGLIIALSGWVQYRYRETRVLTMAQFMEMRYSRRFRIFAGIMSFFSGIINFGIFPAVGGRFFQYFCGLPPYPVSLGFAEIDLTFAAIMAVLLTISLAFTFMGGQIAVIVTDFVQGAFSNIAFFVLAVYILFFRFDWSTMLEAFSAAPADASLINPAHSSGTENFSASYFLVGLFGAFLNAMAWQGSQGYFGCATTPHAARMGRVVGQLRPLVQNTAIVLLVLAAYTFLHHASFAQDALGAEQVLDGINSETIRGQQTVTVALAHLLPTGLLGLLAAVMFAAFVSTHDTYLHSWGSIFIQDVLLPIRLMIRGDDTPISEKTHMKMLRYSILGVALFIFLFSLFFSQQQDILMFFALTGTFYLGWAGWAICGGLYWSRGTTPGVWAAALTGLALSIGGWFITYHWDTFRAFLEALNPALWTKAENGWPDLAGDKCPINAQILFFWSMLITGIVYVVVSLLSGKDPFNMDRMLHRGSYAVEGGEQPVRGWRALKMDHKFALDDKILYVASLIYTLAIFAVFIVLTVVFTVFGIDFGDGFWGVLWYWYALGTVLGGGVILVWLTWGGIRDLRRLFRDLSRVRRNASDDGTVVAGQALADLESVDTGENDRSTNGKKE